MIRKISQEEGLATHSSILAWRIPWTEEPGGLGSESDMTKATDHTRTHTSLPKPLCPLKPGLIPSPPASTPQPSWNFSSSCQDARCCPLLVRNVSAPLLQPHPCTSGHSYLSAGPKGTSSIKSSPPCYTCRAMKLPFLPHPFQCTHRPV